MNKKIKNIGFIIISFFMATQNCFAVFPLIPAVGAVGLSSLFASSTKNNIQTEISLTLKYAEWIMNLFLISGIFFLVFFSLIFAVVLAKFVKFWSRKNKVKCVIKMLGEIRSGIQILNDPGKHDDEIIECVTSFKRDALAEIITEIGSEMFMQMLGKMTAQRLMIQLHEIEENKIDVSGQERILDFCILTIKTSCL